jgi:two-component system sensor histidine kinase UhpB
MGLKSVLVELVNEWKRRHQESTILFDCQADFSQLEDSKQLHIYRIVQEALTNVSRHADVDKVTVDVTLKSSRDGIDIKVADDGKGTDNAQHNAGYGLIGMRERVADLAGQIEIFSKKGQGFSIYIKIPL